LPIGKKGLSLWITNLSGIAISNSSTLDGATYLNTYDNGITNAMTVLCWAKGVPGGWNPWVSKYGEGPGWQLRVNGGNTPCWTVRGTGGNDDMTSTIGGIDGNWHFYAGTYDAVSSNRNLYVDGVLAAQETNNALYTMSPASHLTIGAKDGAAGNGFGNYYNGEIYGVRIYNVALTPDQVNSFLTWAAPGVPSFSGGAAAASTGPAGSQLVLTWNSGFLFEAPTVTGPWTPTGATSPYTNITTNAQMFFRLVNP